MDKTNEIILGWIYWIVTLNFMLQLIVTKNIDIEITYLFAKIFALSLMVVLGLLMFFAGIQYKEGKLKND